MRRILGGTGLSTSSDRFDGARLGPAISSLLDERSNAVLLGPAIS